MTASEKPPLHPAGQDDERATHARAVELLTTNRVSEAFEILHTLVAAGSAHWEVYNDLATIAIRQADTAAAREFLTVAMDKAGAPSRANLNFALVDAAEGRFEEALSTLSPLLRRGPGHADALSLVREILGAAPALSPVAWARLTADLRAANPAGAEPAAALSGRRSQERLMELLAAFFPAPAEGETITETISRALSIRKEAVDGAQRPQEHFFELAAAMPAPRVLELGTLRSIPERPTIHRHLVPHAAEFHGSDIAPGVDVDIVADVHKLSSAVGREQYDIVISCSSFEHFKYPHLAAHEIMKVLRTGGLIYLQTHQTFPLHAYPYDYFRFSKEALRGLFGTRNGCEVLDAWHQFPARILSQQVPDTSVHTAYLNCCALVRKTAPTPEQYIYDLDTDL